MGLRVKFIEPTPQTASSAPKLRSLQSENDFGDVLTVHLYLHPHYDRFGGVGNCLELERRLKELNGANAAALGESIEPPCESADIFRHEAGGDDDTPSWRASHEHPNDEPPSSRRFEPCQVEFECVTGFVVKGQTGHQQPTPVAATSTETTGRQPRNAYANDTRRPRATEAFVWG